MRKAILISILLFASLASSGLARATAQASDRLLIDGEPYALNTNPLGAYLAALGDKAPKFESPHTALWRGYIASWALAEGKLWLTGVEGYRRVHDAKTGQDDIEAFDAMQALFPGSPRVAATWYTGALIVPNGELVDYVHMGYGSTYSGYIVAIVRNGVEAQRLELSREAFVRYRDEQFLRFKATDDYKQAFAGAKAQVDGMSDAEVENFLREFESERYLSQLPAQDALPANTEGEAAPDPR
jgi:hypothetical protein